MTWYCGVPLNLARSQLQLGKNEPTKRGSSAMIWSTDLKSSRRFHLSSSQDTLTQLLMICRDSIHPPFTSLSLRIFVTAATSAVGFVVTWRVPKAGVHDATVMQITIYFKNFIFLSISKQLTYQLVLLCHKPASISILSHLLRTAHPKRFMVVGRYKAACCAKTSNFSAHLVCPV